jgi:tetratricopeptide (TPR) repeat protein
VTIYPALVYVSEMKLSIEYLISVCFILILLFASSLLIFNAYAQQGGAATGGGAQFNQGTGMTITCTVNNACIITGNSANGGSATGGNAIGSGIDKSGSSQTSNNINNNSNTISNSIFNALGIDSLTLKTKSFFDNKALVFKGIFLYGLGNYTEAITYFDKALAIDPNYKLARDNKALSIEKLNNGDSK